MAAVVVITTLCIGGNGGRLKATEGKTSEDRAFSLFGIFV